MNVLELLGDCERELQLASKIGSVYTALSRMRGLGLIETKTDDGPAKQHLTKLAAAHLTAN